MFLRFPREQESDYGILWLQGDLATDVTLARKSLENLPQHLGLVRGRRGMGYRVMRGDLGAARKVQGQDPNPIFLLEGFPPDAVSADISEVLQKWGWDAAILDDSRRMGNGGATWKARAAGEPPAPAMQLEFGDQQCLIHIRELGVSAPMQASPNSAPSQVVPPKSWSEAVAPRVMKKTELVQQTNPPPPPPVAGAAVRAPSEQDGKKRRVAFTPMDDGAAGNSDARIAILTQQVQQQGAILQQLLEAMRNMNVTQGPLAQPTPAMARPGSLPGTPLPESVATPAHPQGPPSAIDLSDSDGENAMVAEATDNA